MGRTNPSIQVAEEVKRHFPGQVYALGDSPSKRAAQRGPPATGKPALAYDKYSWGAEAYQRLAEEMIERGCFT